MALFQFLAIALLTPVDCKPTRSVSWWFEVANNATVDAANVAALKALIPAAVTRVMPDFDAVKGDKGEILYGKEVPMLTPPAGNMYGDMYTYWNYEEEIKRWLTPLKALGCKVLPWALDTTNATMVHEKVYPNATAYIAEAVAVAEHFGFDGWHIDYEDEHPSDQYPTRNDDLRAFLKQFSDALHAKDMELVIDVAGWSGLLSNYSNLAASGVDELQDMSFYARPGSYKSDLANYFGKVREGKKDKSWASIAGVGIGIYYDGRNGYPREWNETTARDFVAEVVAQGGTNLDIFRLNKDGVNDWPHENWWWTVIEDFASGKDSASIRAGRTIFVV